MYFRAVLPLAVLAGSFTGTGNLRRILHADREPQNWLSHGSGS
jgi:hypothetical protein